MVDKYTFSGKIPSSRPIFATKQKVSEYNRQREEEERKKAQAEEAKKTLVARSKGGMVYKGVTISKAPRGIAFEGKKGARLLSMRIKGEIGKFEKEVGRSATEQERSDIRSMYLGTTTRVSYSGAQTQETRGYWDKTGYHPPVKTFTDTGASATPMKDLLMDKLNENAKKQDLQTGMSYPKPNVETSRSYDPTTGYTTVQEYNIQSNAMQERQSFIGFGSSTTSATTASANRPSKDYMSFKNVDMSSLEGKKGFGLETALTIGGATEFGKGLVMSPVVAVTSPIIIGGSAVKTLGEAVTMFKYNPAGAVLHPFKVFSHGVENQMIEARDKPLYTAGILTGTSIISGGFGSVKSLKNNLPIKVSNIKIKTSKMVNVEKLTGNFENKLGKNEFFHGTQQKNIKSIQDRGLLPGGLKRTDKNVWLTKDIELAKTYWGGDNTIIKIKLTEKQLRGVKVDSEMMNYPKNLWEYKITEKIKPEQLEIIETSMKPKSPIKENLVIEATTLGFKTPNILKKLGMIEDYPIISKITTETATRSGKNIRITRTPEGLFKNTGENVPATEIVWGKKGITARVNIENVLDKGFAPAGALEYNIWNRLIKMNEGTYKRVSDITPRQLSLTYGYGGVPVKDFVFDMPILKSKGYDIQYKTSRRVETFMKENDIVGYGSSISNIFLTKEGGVVFPISSKLAKMITKEGIITDVAGKDLARITKGFKQIKTGDIDAIAPKLTVSELTPKLEKLVNDLNKLYEDGAKLRLSKDNIIEWDVNLEGVKAPKGSGEKFFEAKSGINQASLNLYDTAESGIAGFPFLDLHKGSVGKTILAGESKWITVGEQLQRKIAGRTSLTKKGADTGADSFNVNDVLGINKRALKDTAGAIPLIQDIAYRKSKSINPASRIFGRKLLESSFEEFKTYNPAQRIDIIKKLQEITNAPDKAMLVIKSDFDLNNAIRSSKVVNIRSVSSVSISGASPSMRSLYGGGKSVISSPTIKSPTKSSSPSPSIKSPSPYFSVSPYSPYSSVSPYSVSPSVSITSPSPTSPSASPSPYILYTKLRTPPSPYTKQSPPTKTPQIIKFSSDKQSKDKRSKRKSPYPQLSEVFDVLVKSKGKFSLAASGLKYSDALDVGAMSVDTSSSARFKLVKRLGMPQVSPIQKGYYGANISKFRPYRINRGRKIGMNLEFIERSGSRIDTTGEKQQITALGIAAVKRNKKGRVRIWGL